MDIHFLANFWPLWLLACIACFVLDSKRIKNASKEALYDVMQDHSRFDAAVDKMMSATEKETWHGTAAFVTFVLFLVSFVVFVHHEAFHLIWGGKATRRVSASGS